MKKLFVLFLFINLFILLIDVPFYANEKNPPEHSRFFYEERGQAIWEVPAAKKMIALTFDDGPSETYTPQILKVLNQYEAKATFFVVGSRVKENKKLLKQMTGDGHELANHTYHHPNFRGLSATEITEELHKAEKEIKAITGTSPVLFRPPGGYYNDTIINTANEEGYTVIMWSWHQDTYDWKQPGVQKIVNKVLTNAQDGDIVLFHDYGGNRSQTVNALKQILPALHKQGYRFVTVSELLKANPKYKILQPFGAGS